MSIALTRRVKDLERKLLILEDQIDRLNESVTNLKALSNRRGPGRPRKEETLPGAESVPIAASALAGEQHG